MPIIFFLVTVIMLNAALRPAMFYVAQQTMLNGLRAGDVCYKSIKAYTQFFGYNFSSFKVYHFWEPNEAEALAMEIVAHRFYISNRMTT